MLRFVPHASRRADANNQWRLADALVEDPRATPFFQAMKLAKGTVSVLDAHGIVFSRVWCAASPPTQSPPAQRMANGCRPRLAPPSFFLLPFEL